MSWRNVGRVVIVVIALAATLRIDSASVGVLRFGTGVAIGHLGMVLWFKLAEKGG